MALNMPGRHGFARRWECLCDCGNTIIVSTAQINKIKIPSCGCAKREAIGRAKWKGVGELSGDQRNKKSSILMSFFARFTDLCTH